MKSLIVCTHGVSGIEMVKSAEMICGKQENVEEIGFLEGESLEELKQKFDEALNKLDRSKGVYIFLDIQGGTPFNVAYNYLNGSDEFALYTGVNIPMLIEFFVSRNTLNQNELAAQIVDSARNSISLFNQINTVVEDEEF